MPSRELTLAALSILSGLPWGSDPDPTPSQGSGLTLQTGPEPLTQTLHVCHNMPISWGGLRVQWGGSPTSRVWVRVKSMSTAWAQLFTPRRRPKHHRFPMHRTRRDRDSWDLRPETSETGSHWAVGRRFFGLFRSENSKKMGETPRHSGAKDVLVSI